MKCEFEYCVYNRKCNCILDEIQIDRLGICESCEIVTIPEGKLEKYKEERLKEIENMPRR